MREFLAVGPVHTSSKVIKAILVVRLRAKQKTIYDLRRSVTTNAPIAHD